jgi:asparagine synthase (glutamine-hydrolysing)
MCGIVGVALPDRAPVDRGVLERMTASLMHRGPDGAGSHLEPGLGLGHRRLSIVDLSDASAQPMLGPRGSALTFNGEIYNWKSVRAELAAAGRHVSSTGDTEVLLAALDTWGAAALERVEGMFAFGYWDPSARSLLLVRDRFGEKPLYYAAFGENGRDGIAFASELRALFAHPRVNAERVIDGAAVAQFFLHEFVPAPRSILANVRKLEAGHTLLWTDGAGVTIRRYFEPSRGGRTSSHDAATVGELTRELIRRTEDATRARLVADVPVGVFLSGGLDSSFLAACAARVHPRVKTFTIGFDDRTFDESEHARLVAQHLGTEHVEHRLSTRTLVDLVPSTLDWMDEPFADSSLVPTMLLAREARREVTVALGGEGGDELLAGYPTFVVDQALARLPPLPRRMGALARRVAAAVPADGRSFSPSFKARQFAQGLDRTGARRHASWLAAFLPEDLERVAGPRLTDGARVSAFDAVDASARGARTPFDAATAFYLSVYLGEGVLTKVDRATMRASLEARAPLLDTKVVELCLSLPPSLCVHGRVTKWLMREAVKELLPASIVGRAKKGFGAPVGAWLRGPLRALAEATLAPARVNEGGWLDGAAIARMLAAHVAGEADLRKPLWAALVFECWRQKWGT